MRQFSKNHAYHATAKGYLRSLSNFQATYFAHISHGEEVSAAVQNTRKLRQQSRFNLRWYLARSLICHLIPHDGHIRSYMQ